jgi:exosortase/archaeosortase
MSNTHHVVTAHDFRVDPHFPLDTTSTVLAGLLAWTMFGLWLYLDYRSDAFQANKVVAFFFVLFCGPAAWLIVIWKASHHGEAVFAKKVRRARQSAWVIGEHWRN